MTVRQDVVYAARLLRGTPVFTLTAILSLTIGIGANAAIFSLADALLLRPRPGISNPDTLVDVGRTQRGEGFDNMSYLNYVDYRDRNTVFSGLAGYRFGAEPIGLGARDGAESVFGAGVSGNYFDVLGVPMAVGRGFIPSEDRPGGAQVAVLSHGLWQRRFEGAGDIVGRTIRLNGRPFTVIGVTAAGFVGNSFTQTDLWIPLTVYPATAGRSAEMLTDRSSVWMVAVGRLKSGVTLDQAHAQMSAIAGDLEDEYPRENEGKGVALSPSHRLPGFMRTYATAFMGLLFALVGLVLAIACTNVAGMMLARSLARAREIAVRIAIGAGKARIVRQLVTESLLLSLVGAAGGIVLAVWMIRALRALLPSLPVVLALDIRLDWRVLAFSVILAIAAGLLFGLAPALQAAKTDLTTAMRSDGSAFGPRRLRLRQAFVVAQVAMSVLLVVCGVLFTRSLINASSVDPGFDIADVEVADIDFRLAGYEREAGALVQDQILDRVERLAGVQSASFVGNLPLIGSSIGLGRLRTAGQPPDAPGIRADWNMVTPRYFETMRTTVLRGRSFTTADRDGAPPVAIVNETLARRAWPGEDPMGKSLEHGDGDTKRVLQIVGVARDGKYRWVTEEPRAFIYVPLAQNYRSNLSLLVKTDGRRVASDIRAVVRAINPNLPVTHSATLAEVTAVGLLPHRLAAGIAGTFGLVGIVLAAIGVYGITAYNVTQRTREIGVRVALGAAHRDVLRLVIGQAMRMSATGAAIGLLLALAATRLLVTMLYGVQPLDPVSFGTGAALLAALAFAASWVPARRAALLNPVEALRTE